MALMAGDPLWTLRQRMGNTSGPPIQPSVDNSAAGLSARYGNAPETHEQLAKINGWAQPAQQPQLNGWGLPWGQSPPTAQQRPDDSVRLPAATPQPVTPAGGGGDYNSLLQELLTNARSNSGLDSIHDAYNQQSKLAAEAAGLSWTDDMASRGMLPGDNQSRDLKARLVGQAMSPIAANRAAAVADWNSQRDSRLQSVAGMMSDQQQREAERQRQAAADAESRRRFDAEMGYNQSRLDYQRTSDAQTRQDELNRISQLQQTMSGQGGGGVQSGGGGQVAYSGGGGSGERQRVMPTQGPSYYDLLASLPGQGGGRTREEVLGGSGGGAPDNATGGGVSFSGFNGGQMNDPAFGQRLGGNGGIFRDQPSSQQAATSFSGVATGGGANSFARPGGGGSAPPASGAVGAPITGGAQVMGGLQGSQTGFGGGPTQGNPNYNSPLGFTGYGQSWNQPQLAGQAAGVKRYQDLQNAAMGRTA